MQSATGRWFGVGHSTAADSAKGIENAAQLEALRRLGCSYGQSYHLRRPTDPADLPPLLSRHP